MLAGAGLAAQPSDSLFWNQNARPLTLEGDSLHLSFSMLDSAVGGYQFFFTAEEHWKTINTRIQFAFLQYLHQRAGVRNLIIEGGYSYGFLINRYLETGDQRLLRKALNNVPVCPDDLMDMFVQLRAYNLRFPEAERIQVTGIDLEHAPELALQCLYALRPDGQEVPGAIAPVIAQIQKLHESRYYDKRAVRTFFRRLQGSMAARPEQHSRYWQDQYARARLITDNAVQGFEFGLFKAMIQQEAWEEREKRLFSNFVRLAPYMKPGKYYAQFGALHTDIERSFRWDFPTLAHRLNFFDTSPVAGRVLTISRYLDQADGYRKTGEYDALQQLIGQVSDRYPGNVVLFPLRGPGSPFEKLSRNFQYMLWIDPVLEAERCD